MIQTSSLLILGFCVCQSFPLHHGAVRENISSIRRGGRNQSEVSSAPPKEGHVGGKNFNNQFSGNVRRSGTFLREGIIRIQLLKIKTENSARSLIEIAEFPERNIKVESTVIRLEPEAGGDGSEKNQLQDNAGGGYGWTLGCIALTLLVACFIYRLFRPLFYWPQRF